MTAPTPLTPARLAELRRLTDEATPEPWHYTDSEAVNDVWEGGVVVVSKDRDPIANVCDEWYEPDPGEPAPVNDAAFIAAARSAVPELLDALARVEALLNGDLARIGARVARSAYDDNLDESESAWRTRLANEIVATRNALRAAVRGEGR